MTCTICRDVGFITRGDRDVLCRCRIVEGIRVTLGMHPELKGIKLKEGLVANHRDPVQGSKVIRCKWDEFRQHLLGWMWASYLRDDRVRLLITSDVELRNRWLGKGDGSSETHSTLSSLQEFGLVVVRINRIKHGATPQALMEAALYAPRLWIVHDPGDSLTTQHPSWSQDLEEMLGETRIDLAGELVEKSTNVLNKFGIGGGVQ